MKFDPNWSNNNHTVKIFESDPRATSLIVSTKMDYDACSEYFRTSNRRDGATLVELSLDSDLFDRDLLRQLIPEENPYRLLVVIKPAIYKPLEDLMEIVRNHPPKQMVLLMENLQDGFKSETLAPTLGDIINRNGGKVHFPVKKPRPPFEFN